MIEVMECGGVRKHMVIKLEDMEAIKSEIPELPGILGLSQIAIAVKRKIAGKKPLPEYIVVNTDEPYIDEIIEVLKRHGHWGIPATPAESQEQAHADTILPAT